MSVEKILEEREKTHGDFGSHAKISQDLKRVLVKHGEGKLSDPQAEALGMIAHKIARILNGNPNHKDHWDDIAGYATLVSKQIEKEKPA